jgi:hypothetical protein
VLVLLTLNNEHVKTSVSKIQDMTGQFRGAVYAKFASSRTSTALTFARACGRICNTGVDKRADSLVK